MIRVFSFLIGIFLIIISQSLFGPWSFYPLAACYAYALYFLFYGQGNNAFYFLAGLTVANELLGNSHFGLATLLAFILIGLYYIFHLRLRLTSSFLRYAICLIFGLIAYCFLLYPFSHITQRLFNVTLLYLPLCAGAFLLTLGSKTTSYELL